MFIYCSYTNAMRYSVREETLHAIISLLFSLLLFKQLKVMSAQFKVEMQAQEKTYKEQKHSLKAQSTFCKKKKEKMNPKAMFSALEPAKPCNRWIMGSVLCLLRTIPPAAGLYQGMALQFWSWVNCQWVTTVVTSLHLCSLRTTSPSSMGEDETCSLFHSDSRATHRHTKNDRSQRAEELLDCLRVEGCRL